MILTEANRQTWSIIVFAYNEQGVILKTLEQTATILQELSPAQNELIIVDDGSTDGTSVIIDAFAEGKSFVKVIRHNRNKGIGPALISGYRMASMENVCAVPADGQFNTEELLQMPVIPPHTIVSFYRPYKKLYSPFRKLLTYCNRFLNHHLLGIKIKDVNWIKVYKNEDLKSTNLAVTSSLVESEICAKVLTHNKQLIEIKSNYGAHLYGKPKGASFKIVFQAMVDVFRLYKEVMRYRKSSDQK